MDPRIIALFPIRQDECLRNTLRPIFRQVDDITIPEIPYELPEYVRVAWENAYLSALRVRKEMAQDQFGDPIGGFAQCTSWKYLDCALLIWISECQGSGGPITLLDAVRSDLNWCRVLCDTLVDIPLCRAMGFREVPAEMLSSPLKNLT